MKKISLEEQKQLELQIMDVIDAFCREHGLQYYLIGGSLIGAVRHQGFIPWDDDMDICMMREDYQRFLESFNENRTDAYRLIWYGNTDGFHLPFAKVIDTRTVMRENAAEFTNVIQFSVNVDVFPLDICPNSITRIKMIRFRESLLSQMVFCKRLTNKDRQKWYSKIYFFFLQFPAAFFSEKALLSKKHRIAMKFRNQKENIYVCDLVFMWYGMGEVHKSEWYSKPIELPFEGRHYFAPQNYDAILTSAYGDYMTPPPPEKRVLPHTVEAYWKDEENL